MICKQCGTQSREDFCPRCGEILRPGAIRLSAPIEEPKTEPTPKPQRQRRNPPLRLKMVLAQAIALFLPLAYFFFDFFVVLSDRLFEVAEGKMQLSRLVQLLCNTMYESNAVGEIAEATMGGSVELLHAVSPFSLPADLAAGRTELLPLLLPILLTLALALLCAACGVFLILTGGRILRMRLFCNLALLGGVGATFAPLIGSLLLRLLYCFGKGTEAADLAMQKILPSLEALCIMGILICALLPAIASLRRLGAYAKRESDLVLFPYHWLTKAPYGFGKTLAALALLGSMLLTAVCFLRPITTLGRVTDLTAIAQQMTAEGREVLSVGKELISGNSWSVDFIAFGGHALRLADLLWVAIVLLGEALLLLCLLRLLLLKKKRLCKKKGPKRFLRKIGDRIRCTLLSPYVVFAVVHTLLVLLMLFASPLKMHMDFSGVTDTLTAIYLVIAHVRILGGINTFYVFLAAAGSLLWHTAAQASAALVVKSHNED